MPLRAIGPAYCGWFYILLPTLIVFSSEYPCKPKWGLFDVPYTRLISMLANPLIRITTQLPVHSATTLLAMEARAILLVTTPHYEA